MATFNEQLTQLKDKLDEFWRSDQPRGEVSYSIGQKESMIVIDRSRQPFILLYMNGRHLPATEAEIGVFNQFTDELGKKSFFSDETKKDNDLRNEDFLKGIGKFKQWSGYYTQEEVAKKLTLALDSLRKEFDTTTPTPHTEKITEKTSNWMVLFSHKKEVQQKKPEQTPSSKNKFSP